MQFFSKNLTDMTDGELTQASLSLVAMMDATNDRRAEAVKTNSKFRKRIKNFPTLPINPAFMELKAAVENELLNRKKSND